MYYSNKQEGLISDTYLGEVFLFKCAYLSAMDPLMNGFLYKWGLAVVCFFALSLSFIFCHTFIFSCVIMIMFPNLIDL